MGRSRRSGPQPSAADFVAREFNGLVRLAYGLSGRQAVAEDLVSAAIAGAFEHWESIENHSAYVRRSLVNLYLNEVRRQRVAASYLHHFEARVDDPAADVIRRLDVDDALAHLSPLQQAVIVLRFLDDRSVKDTADILGRPAGSIRRITHEAVAALRVNFGLSGYGTELTTQETK